MLKMISEIRKELEQDLYAINVHRWDDTIELHYSSETFRDRFKDFHLIAREPESKEYPFEAVADIGDGIIAFCLITEEIKKQWEAELDARRNDSTSCERSAS